MLLLSPAWGRGSSLSTDRHDAKSPSPTHLRKVYSPKLVEEEFSEVELPLYGVLGSWVAGSCISPVLVV
jgi:hypothetical protein